ncbi:MULTISPECIES: hypothetical protein [unclassified Bradyrhizobium]|uniref:hypothetical protein n=1 Tax=unclassified Bradyrhizobium TaxID=2631580 RepID=UPI0028F0C62B|nr:MULTISPECIES: hypothetical protein [unclassified Bradyrhizobium]
MKTIAQGMPDVGWTCGDCRLLFVAGGPWVAASTRHSLRPRDFRGSIEMHSPGVIAPRRMRLRARWMPSLTVRTAIADHYRSPLHGLKVLVNFVLLRLVHSSLTVDSGPHGFLLRQVG